MNEKIVWIPIDKIFIADYNPRIALDPQSIQELAENIRQTGIVDALHVRPEGDKYECFDGQRRFKAVLLLKWKEAPCIIHNITREQAMKLSLSIHAQREDLTDEEWGLFIERLLNEKIFNTAKDVAIFLGKSYDWVIKKHEVLKTIKHDEEARRLKQENPTLDLKTLKSFTQLPREEKKETLEYIQRIPDKDIRYKIVQRKIEEPDKPLEKIHAEIEEEKTIGFSTSKPITLNLTYRYHIWREKENITIMRLKGQTLQEQITIPVKDIPELIQNLKKLT